MVMSLCVPQSALNFSSGATASFTRGILLHRVSYLVTSEWKGRSTTSQMLHVNSHLRVNMTVLNNHSILPVMRHTHHNHVHKSPSLHITNQFNQFTPYFMEWSFLLG